MMKKQSHRTSTYEMCLVHFVVFFVLGCREKSNSQQVSAYFGLWNTECVKLANIAVSDWERMEL